MGNDQCFPYLPLIIAWVNVIRKQKYMKIDGMTFKKKYIQLYIKKKSKIKNHTC